MHPGKLCTYVKAFEKQDCQKSDKLYQFRKYIKSAKMYPRANVNWNCNAVVVDIN